MSIVIHGILYDIMCFFCYYMIIKCVLTKKYYTRYSKIYTSKKEIKH
jgi:hypothetical protein